MMQRDSRSRIENVSPGGVELEAGRGIPELALTHGGVLEGRVLDGEGRPVTGATVRALVNFLASVRMLWRE
jgi:hypothetical protein